MAQWVKALTTKPDHLWSEFIIWWMCVCVCVCVYEHMRIPVYQCGYIFTKAHLRSEYNQIPVLTLNQPLYSPCWFLGFLKFICLFGRAGISGICYCFWLYVGSGVLNSDLHGCVMILFKLDHLPGPYITISKSAIKFEWELFFFWLNFLLLAPPLSFHKTAGIFWDLLTYLIMCVCVRVCFIFFP